MDRVADELAALSLFRDPDPSGLAERGVSAGAIAATAGAWSSRSLAAGEVLWRENDFSDKLAVVLEGSLEAVVAGQALSCMGPGALVGEGSAFLAGEERTATVRAATAARLLVLGKGRLAALRDEHAEVYDFLLERALLSLARRVDDNGARVARLAAGAVARVPRDSPSILARSWRRMAAQAAAAPASPLPAMRLLPVLMSAPEPMLDTIAASMTPTWVSDGEALLHEGDPGEAAFLVADGRFDVLRDVAAGGAIRLDTLVPGSFFGTGALLLGRPRIASCVAERGSWAYGIDRAALRGLGGEAGRLFREAMLGALRVQIVSVSEHLARLEEG